jgi:hypothetical protein
MARAFRTDGDGRVVTRLEPYEVAILRGLVNDVTTLVGAAPAGNAAYDRLFPPPSRDEEAARELRELIHEDLREAKLAAARDLLDSLPDDGRVALTREVADQWLTALNDVRLALGTSIGITEESYDTGDDADPSLHVYHWLTFLQDTLIESLNDAGVER